MLSFLEFCYPRWYRLARETGRHFCLSVPVGHRYHDCIIVGGFKVQGVFECVSVCVCVSVYVSVCECV